MFSSLLHAVSQQGIHSPPSSYVNVLIKFDGSWNSVGDFVYKNVFEIHLPCSSGFHELSTLIRQTTTPYGADLGYIISYLSEDSHSITFIEDDRTLQHYIGLKLTHNDIYEIPLCVGLWTDTPSSLGDHAIANHVSHHDDGGSDFLHDDVLSDDNDVSRSEGLSQSDEGSQPSNILGNSSGVVSLFDTYASHSPVQNNMIVPVEDFSPCTPPSTSRMDYDDFDDVEGTKVITSGDSGTIAVNAMFESKKVLIYHLKRLAIANFFQFKTWKSNKSFLHVRCVDYPRCQWTVRAVRVDHQTDIFQIRRYDHEHQCSVDARKGKSRQATYDIVADLVKHEFHDATKKSYPPKSIIADMQREHGIHMTYKKAWFAKEKALELCHGTSEESYASLPALCYMMNSTNPGSLIQLCTSHEGVFKYLFISLYAWREGWPHCVPVLIIDGSFMKSYYKGTLLSAVARDSNSQIFPLAFGFCDAENTENWTWFLSKVKDALCHRPVQFIISDRHDGIINAVSSVFPGVSHGHCIYHIFNNLKSSYNGKEKSLSWKFYGAARAATQGECKRYVQYFDHDDKHIRGYLHGIGYEKWARSFATNRYSIMTSNLAESMNSVDAIPREYPIAKLVEFLLGRMQTWFHDRRELANATTTILSKHYEKKLNELHVASAVMDVRPASITEYLVFEDDGRSFVVNLGAESCTCGEFQIDKFICTHGVAVCRYRKSFSCYDYVSEIYTTKEWRAAYSEVIHPIPSKESWVFPDDVKSVVCLPPLCSKRPPGRPKKRRIPSRGETAKRQQCSRCKLSGHNRKTCSNPLARK